MKSSARVVLLVVAAALAGCDQKSSSNAGAPGGGAGSPASAPASYVGAMGKAQNFAASTADLSSLNNGVQQFSAAEGRFPKDLDELIAMKYFPRLPAPPPGMKYDYDATSGRVGLSPK
jgi:hypothetical protein